MARHRSAIFSAKQQHLAEIDFTEIQKFLKDSFEAIEPLLIWFFANNILLQRDFCIIRVVSFSAARFDAHSPDTCQPQLQY